MKWIFFGLFYCFFAVYAENPILKKSHNFGPKGNFGTYQEMKIWAKYQMMSVTPDHSGYGLQDGIFAWVPEKGIEVVLQADTTEKKQIYLYLDLLNFTRLNKNAIMEPGVLNIYINNRLKTRIYSDAERNFENPVKISIDPVELRYQGNLELKSSSVSVSK